MLRNWALQASQDGVHWIDLQTYVNDTSIAAPFSSATFFGVDANMRAIDIGYRWFRILQVGRNMDGSYYLNLAGWELYGILFSEYLVIFPAPFKRKLDDAGRAPSQMSTTPATSLIAVSTAIATILQRVPALATLGIRVLAASVLQVRL